MHLTDIPSMFNIAAAIRDYNRLATEGWELLARDREEALRTKGYASGMERYSTESLSRLYRQESRKERIYEIFEKFRKK
jgi:hypothetical protein